MNFEDYQQTFMGILSGTEHNAPYDNPDYLNYTKLNWARQHRWLKTGVLNDDLVRMIRKINEEQYWTVITEPWCGDASHTLPFIHRLAEQNPLIEVDYQLRDAPPFLIDSYLTNGSKSIPKLIMKDKNGHTLNVWGPRPLACQLLYDELLRDHVEMEQKKMALQQWYNADKGVGFQMELLAMMLALSV